MKFRRYLSWILMLFCSAPVLAAAPESLYSNLSDKACHVMDQESEGDYAGQECPGVLGYKLYKHTQEARESLSIVQGDQKQYVDFSPITSQFNHLGDKAEWRIVEGKPVALIVRMYITPENQKPQQQLIVTRVTPGPACIVKVIDASKNPKANELARQAADTSQSLKCLWEPSKE
jgi:hypothetical protein